MFIGFANAPDVDQLIATIDCMIDSNDDNKYYVDLTGCNLTPQHIIVVRHYIANYGVIFNLRKTNYEHTSFAQDIINARILARKRKAKPKQQSHASQYHSDTDVCESRIDHEVAELGKIFFTTEPPVSCFIYHELNNIKHQDTFFNPYTMKNFNARDTHRAHQFMNNHPNRISPGYMNRERFFAKLRGATKTKFTIFLDIDNTLVHALHIKITNTTAESFSPNPDDPESFEVYIRPYAIEFLTWLHQQTNVERIIMWSAGSESYVQTIRDALCDRAGIDREQIQYISRNKFNTSAKNLIRLVTSDDNAYTSIHLKNVLFVDDIPNRIHGISHNQIYAIPEFIAYNDLDDELRIDLEFPIPNQRTIESERTIN